ncbi:hypothetical protein pb186bvf_021182, partial [Paramecium bursaria]
MIELIINRIRNLIYLEINRIYRYFNYFHFDNSINRGNLIKNLFVLMAQAFNLVHNRKRENKDWMGNLALGG